MTATIVDLFDALGHRSGERVSICHKAPGKSSPFVPRVVDVTEAAQEVAAHADYADVWWGVNPVDPASGRGTVEDVTRWAALYADLDVKPGGMPSLDAAQAVIDELSNQLGVLPVAVTFSGHGLQPYWALDPDDPDAHLADDTRRATAQATLRRFGRLVAAVAGRLGGHVDSVFDLTRVLRAPGTVNRKGAPIPVVTALTQGSPLTIERVVEVLDEYGVATYDDDAKTPGEMVSSPDDWTPAVHTCTYAQTMISGWERDRPPARHPWFMGQATRLAAARRYGCLTAADADRAVETLNARMRHLVATIEPIRELTPGELSDGHSWAVAEVSTMAEDHVRRELGGHKHAIDPMTLLAGDGVGGVTQPLSAPLSSQASSEVPGQSVAEDSPSWGEVDLSEYLDGTFVPQVPELLKRTDGQHLLYRGRVHSFHGESESGKSWLALAAAAEELMAGNRCLMIDFESDAATTVGRLLRMGVPPNVIGRLFSYRRPEVNPASLARELVAWSELLSEQYAVAILDGVTEALAVFGVTSKDNDEVTVWIRTVPRKLASATGAAVTLVDHVTKDADSRGRFAIGGQAKMAALDGAAYVIEVLEPLGVGLVGRVSMRVAKDRPGGIRPHSGPYRKSDRTQEAAIVTIDSSTTGVTTVRVDGPRYDTADTPADKRHPFQPTGLMEKVSRVLENANCPMSRSAIDASVQGRREFVFQAIDCLILDDYAAEDGPSKNGGRPTVRLIRSYREAGDPFPDLDPLDLVPEDCRGPRTRSGVTTPEPAERVGPPSDTRSRNGSGTGRERVGLDSLYTQGDEDATDGVNSEDSPVQEQLNLRNPGGNGSGTGPSEGDLDE